MKVALDNIIFSIQRYGGVSVVWRELLRRARADRALEVTELDYMQDRTPRLLERYRVPDWTPEEPTVFHSSYFRICPHPQAMNITTVHDLTYHYYRHGATKAVHLWEEERALRHSRAVICVSEHTKQDLLRCYGWIAPERVHVVYNGVSEVFRPISSVEKRGYLLYVGNRRAAYKRFDVAQAVARMTGLELKVADSPSITREDLNRYYNEALCLLYPSDYEGFGLPLVEAQRAGCPVIAQRHSAVPETVGEGGLLVAHDRPERVAEQMAECVRGLLSQSTQGLIEAGLRNASRFSWDQTYEQTKAIYENIHHHDYL